jgi:protein-histidine N-methyltransferase
VPTLLLLDRLLAYLASEPRAATCSPSSGNNETHIHLQDYNRSVLELVTFPNVLLAWYPSILTTQPHLSRASPIKPSQQTCPRSQQSITLPRPTQSRTKRTRTELPSAVLAAKLKQHVRRRIPQRGQFASLVRRPRPHLLHRGHNTRGSQLPARAPR